MEDSKVPLSTSPFEVEHLLKIFCIWQIFRRALFFFNASYFFVALPLFSFCFSLTSDDEMCNFYIMYWTFGDVLKTKNWLVYYFIFFWFWLIIILFYNFASFYSVDLVFLMVRRFTIGLVVDWIMFQRMLLLYDFF